MCFSSKKSVCSILEIVYSGTKIGRKSARWSNIVEGGTKVSEKYRVVNRKGKFNLKLIEWR